MFWQLSTNIHRVYNSNIVKREELIGDTKKTVALFDFDGTLFKGHFWQGIAKHNFINKVRRLPTLVYLSTHYPLWLAGKFKILTEEAYMVRWGEDLSITFKGYCREEMCSVFEWIRDNYVMDLLRPDIRMLLGRHNDRGHTTVLISGTFTDFLETMKQRLGVKHVVGTKLEAIENVYTGKIVRPLCFGINKAKLLQEFIDQAGMDIDLGHSFAYADSIMDAPMLEMVGNPVATYPDKKLLGLAQQKGWQILPSSTFLVK